MLDVTLAGGMARFGNTSTGGNNLLQINSFSGGVATGIGMWAGGSGQIYSSNTLNFLVNGTLGTSFPTGYTTAMTIATSGAVTINAPTTGVAALSVTGTGSQQTIVTTGSGFGAGLAAYGATGYPSRIDMVDGATGNKVWIITNGFAGTGIFSIYDNSVHRFTLNPAGNFTIAAPTSGTAFAISGANTTTGIGLSVTGSYTGAGNTSLVTLTDTNNTNGANLKFSGNGSNPTKTLRARAGNLELMNDAYSATLFSVADSGTVTVNSGAATNVALSLTGSITSNNWQFNNEASGSLIYANTGYLRFANSIGESIRINANNNVTISSPLSGYALQVNGLTGTFAAVLTASDNGLLLANAAATSYGELYYNSGSFKVEAIGSSIPLAFATNGAVRLTVATTGAVSIAAVSSGTALTVNSASASTGLSVVGGANSYAQLVTAPNTSGQSFGVKISAGTTGSDYGFVVQNAAVTTNYLIVNGLGSTLLTSVGAATTLSITNAITSNGSAVIINTAGAGNTGVVGLQISDGVTASVYGYTVGTTHFIGTTTSHSFAIMTNNSNRFSINNSGSITHAGSSFAATSGSGNYTMNLAAPSGGGAYLTLQGNGNAGAAGFQLVQDASGNSYIQTQNATALTFVTNSVGRFQLPATGGYKPTALTVATLPTATGNAGLMAVVSDATVAYLPANVATVVVGSGSNTVPVFCDGTNWRIG
jgi:hypothetical protein